jgi:peptidoglycan/LPS O-acetylase OafA/YrhL
MQNWRLWLLAAVTVAGIAAVFWIPPIPQDPSYHAFADQAALFGTPNFWNVFSNLPFVLVGAVGLVWLPRLPQTTPRLAYIVFCIGVVCVGFGSAYYHYSPTTQTLVWDRLPMTVAFMALFSMVVRDRVSEKLGAALLWPLIAAGVASVFYWDYTELHGQGDLRAYALIQFLPMLLIPLMLLLFTGKGLDARWLWGTLAFYLLAKVTEHFDKAIFDALGFMSGHSIKHALGAVAVLCTIIAVMRSRNGKP